MTQRNQLMDPEWSPTVLMTRRLRDAPITHASRLAECSTIESTLRSGSSNASSSNVDENEGVVHPLAKIAYSRSSCPQPPLDDAVTGGGSSVSSDMHFAGMSVRLDPLERCAPHRIVVPSSEDDMNRTRGELDGTYDTQLNEQRSATWNAITALSTLCDEVQELDGTFTTQILPSIVLFSADDINGALARQSEVKKKDILDEEAQEKRESELLARIGKFLPTLQLASNGTTRIRRLVKNMVVQLGSVQTPSAVPYYYDEQQTTQSDEHGEGMVGSNDEDNGTNTFADDNNASSNKNGTSNRKVREEMQPPVLGRTVPLKRLGNAITTSLRILVTVDNAISTNTDLQEAWAMYKDVVMEWSEQKRVVSLFAQS